MRFLDVSAWLDTPMLLRSLELQNWRNFRKASVDFQPRTFIVGPNASGKSNLLDAIRFLRDLAAEDGGLQRAVKRRNGFGSIRTLFAHGPDSSVELRLVVTIDQEDWRYTLNLQKDADERCVVQAERLLRGSQVIIERKAAGEDLESRSQTRLQQALEGPAKEPFLRGLRSIRYAHLAPELLRTTKLHGDPDLEDFGSRFLERVFITEKPERTRKLKLVNSARPSFANLHLTTGRYGFFETVIRHSRTSRVSGSRAARALF